MSLRSPPPDPPTTLPTLPDSLIPAPTFPTKALPSTTSNSINSCSLPRSHAQNRASPPTHQNLPPTSPEPSASSSLHSNYLPVLFLSPRTSTLPDGTLLPIKKTDPGTQRLILLIVCAELLPSWIAPASESSRTCFPNQGHGLRPFSLLSTSSGNILHMLAKHEAQASSPLFSSPSLPDGHYPTIQDHT